MVTSTFINRIDIQSGQPVYLRDLTSRTQAIAYAALGVPEVWRHQNGKLEIFTLVNREYVESPTSLGFPNIPIIEGISKILRSSSDMLMSDSRKEFRQWVKQINQ